MFHSLNGQDYKIDKVNTINPILNEKIRKNLKSSDREKGRKNPFIC